MEILRVIAKPHSYSDGVLMSLTVRIFVELQNEQYLANQKATRSDV